MATISPVGKRFLRIGKIGIKNIYEAIHENMVISEHFMYRKLKITEDQPIATIFFSGWKLLIRRSTEEKILIN